ncbi:DUF2063 domain-containing protein [Pseudomonas syringae]|nr:DUF2063 domain-containing protein [Pseudomonas syringae]MCF5067772.1 DUF2063 domain-containing protein [Pseudomonas syringae]
MADLPSEQRALTRYLRDPDNQPLPADMNAARVNIYRDLLFNNVSSLLSGTFPVLIRILGDERWQKSVRGFLREHRAQTPKFGEIAREFVGYLAAEPEVLIDGAWPAFMVELAHYEWVEMVLQQSDAEPLPASDAGLLLAQPLRLSPLAWPLSYAWPVQRLAPDYQPTTAPAQPTFLLARRVEDWSVAFSQLSPLAWRLLQRIDELPALTGHQQLEGLAIEAGEGGSVLFRENGLALLQQMHNQSVIGICR